MRQLAFRPQRILLVLAVATSALLTTGCDAGLRYHDGYWAAEVQPTPGGSTLTVINDTFIDPWTRRVTVYAQLRAGEVVTAPPQVGPGPCQIGAFGEAICYHPNAVYLNGSGQELLTDDGTGQWWVKHSWVLDGQGYINCQLTDRVYDNCVPVEGTMLDDGITMKIEAAGPNAGLGYNLRRPLLDRSPIGYEVTRFQAATPGAEPTEQWSIEWECREEVSAFDGQTRSCP